MIRSMLLAGLFAVAVFAVAVFAAGAAWAEETKVSLVARPKVEPASTLYVGNRAPLLPSPLVKMPVGTVKPRGWLRKQMELMADGFSGRLGEISAFLQPQGNAWLDPNGEGDRSLWEELPYWLKGFGNLGYLLEDRRIIAEARRWLEPAFSSQREDGYFGPRRNLDRGPDVKGGPDVWPNMLMLNALQSYYEHSREPRVLALMAKYFHWQMSVPEEKFLLPFWQQQRAADNLQSVYWLYNRTGEPWLLQLGEKIHRRTANWTESVQSWHGVNISQSFRGPGMYYQQSKDPKHLAAVERNYLAVRDLYGQVPGGLYGSDENCRPGFSDPRQAAETCTMCDMMLSHEMLMTISGELRWADRCEDVAFNSLPASMTADYKALRYLTAPNMPLSDRANKAPGIQNGGAMLLFDPRSHRCCQHNIAHGWPYFTEHLWMATAGNGLAAVLYAPCEVHAKAADGAAVTIRQETDYPFSDTIAMTFSVDRPAAFPLYLRLPGWCAQPGLAINGVDVPLPTGQGRYLLVERTWKDDDRLALRLPMSITLTRWVRNKNCVSVNRGPLTYSLRIGERIEKLRKDDKWPAFEFYPTTPWNYGLVLEGDSPAAGIEVAEVRAPVAAQPFTVEAAPVTLRAKAKKIPGWTLDRHGLAAVLQESPIASSEPVETVSLIPMGCARLRIASFPVIGDGPNAKPWLPSAQSPSTRYKATASHCNESDTVDALSSGASPANSNDQSIERFTWWPHLGTEEWVAYELPKPTKVSQVEVYWFDDTGAGQCRVPKSWRLEYRDGEAWKPVQDASPTGTARDKFNVVQFQPVTTTGLRIVAQLQPNFSGGILQWRVK